MKTKRTSGKSIPLKKLCCAELKNSLGYQRASFSRTPSGMVLLKLGQITLSALEAKKRKEKLLKAIGDPEVSEKFRKFKPSGKLPVIKPIKYCPFCGTTL